MGYRCLVANAIDEIIKILNQYQKSNKAFFLLEIKAELKNLLQKTDKKIFDCDSIIKALNDALDKLSDENKTYYKKILFFPSYREESSTLSRLILQANSVREYLCQKLDKDSNTKGVPLN